MNLLRIAAPAFALALIASARADVVINEIMYHPSSELTSEEYIELYNPGAGAVDLSGWKFSNGVQFTFPAATSIPAGGYLVATANPAAFHAKYPAVVNYVSTAFWVGQLSNSSNRIQLDDSTGTKRDEVKYTDDGDWAVRERAAADFGHRGWHWSSQADGLGKSLELINPGFDNSLGQNWGASTTVQGTPGAVNSIHATDIAPVIENASHFPLVPKSSDSVVLSCLVVDDAASTVTVTLHWRNDGGTFASLAMVDDGAHGDAAAGDGVFGAVLPPRANGTIVEFYFTASDTTGHTRTWPAPAMNDAVAEQSQNCLFQVDDTVYAGAEPIYRMILRAVDRTELSNINSNTGTPPYPYNAGETNDQTYSHAAFNATWVTLDGAGPALNYLSGARNRGNGSRLSLPQSYNIDFTNEHTWKGVTSLNLNTQQTPYQLLGSAVVRRSGLTMADSRAVQVRVNATNLAGAGSPSFGFYAANEVQDSDFADHHFPLDSSGNLYRGQRIDTLGGANLRDQSASQPAATADPTPYRVNYFKQTNSSEDKWADLIGLTKSLAKGTAAADYSVTYSVSAADYETTMLAAADTAQWVRYMAVNTIIDNSETNISMGEGDDYYVYFGVTDPRMKFITYDLDTIEGGGGATNSTTHSIFRMSRSTLSGNPPTHLHPFMQHPRFAREYLAELKRQLDGPLSVAQFDATTDEVLGSVVAAGTITSIKAFHAARVAYIQGLLPLSLSSITATTTAGAGLTTTNGYPLSSAATCNLLGKANCTRTASVKVNGVAATYTPWKVTAAAAFTTSIGDWQATSVALTPGINKVVIQAFDENNVEIEKTTFDVWYDDASVATAGGTLVANTNWTAAGGPYRLTSNLVVPAGITLTIGPGTTVYCSNGASAFSITVNGTGKISAVGTETQRIVFTKEPSATVNWASLDFINTTAESTLSYVTFDNCAGSTIGGHNAQCHANNAIVFFDHLAYPANPAANVEYLSFDAASFIVQNCVFPTYPGSSGPESLHGINGIMTGGHGIFRDNYFGHTWGFNDTIDFTGGNRPGPILQVINNVFDGASDDCLDLDSTDAWIEGNVFLHVHRDPTRTDQAIDTGSAISGGVDTLGQNSDWTIINNLFYDVDHVFLNKGNSTSTGNGGGRVAFLYNTVAHVQKESSGSTQAEIATFDWSDDNIALPDPAIGSGMYAAYNILYDAAALNFHYSATNHTVIFDNNIFPVEFKGGANEWAGAGSGNQYVDPRLNLGVLNGTPVASVTAAQVRQAFQPLPGSPALSTAFGGRNLGGLNPHGIAIAGEPSGTTSATSATLTVGPGGTFNWGTTTPQGWGWVAYKWKLDNGAYSAEIPVTNNSPFTNYPTISLTGLTNGTHTVTVIGKNDNGFYQDDTFLYPLSSGTPAAATVSKTWTVNTAYVPPPGTPNVQISEILAKNTETLGFSGNFPDIIELRNIGSATANIEGWGLTDNTALPYKYTFPLGTTLAPGARLVIYGSSSSSVPAPKTGFGLKDTGDTLTLTKSVAAGGTVADSISFGAQLPDVSVGRRESDGVWDMCKPSFGAANVVAAQGVLSGVKINEWLADAVALFPNDFIELMNTSTLPVNVGNCYVTDNPVEWPMHHQLRQLTFIAPSSYLYLKADGDPTQGPDHLSFKLSPSQGEIAVFDSALTLLDNVVYGPQSSDVSEGRTPNGTSTIAFFNQPTPGGPNPGVAGTTTTTTTTNLISVTAAWKYMVSSTDLSATFYPKAFNDAAWPSGGQLLYLEPDPLPTTAGLIKTTALPGDASNGGLPFNTSYFRTHFTYSGSLTGVTLTATIMIDDGAVFYLNGTEIPNSRLRMPSGTVTFSTIASTNVSNAAVETITLDSSLLAVGDNVLAVEVHQQHPVGTQTSSDITFGLKLDATVTTTVSGGNAIVLNEVLPINTSFQNPDSSFAGWVELFNPTATAIDVGDMSLTDDVAAPRKFVFPAATMVPANGYLTTYFNPLTAASATNTGFGLPTLGGGVYLFDAVGIGGGLHDSVNYGLQIPNFGLGRVPNGSGAFVLSVPTRGALNSAAGVASITGVKINEWLANPTAAPTWFELYNTNAQPVALGGNYLTDQLTNKTKYLFPPLTFIGGTGASRWVQIIADNDAGATPGHVNFSLNSAGESLGLFSGSGVQLESVTYGAQSFGISQGRFPDGTSAIVSLTPTPGAANQSAPADTDHDGIPDTWELANGLNPNDPTDAAKDSDGDGMTNYQEYLAGTNPMQPGSHLAATVQNAATPGQFSITFTALAGHTYTVRYKSDLTVATWTNLQDISAPPSDVVVTVTDAPPANTPKRFYQVVTPAQP